MTLTTEPHITALFQISNLVGICRKKNYSIQIMLSAILPRPVDHTIIDPMIRSINKHPREFMSNSRRFKIVCTFKLFMYAKSIRVGLFAKRYKGLHLHTEGTNTLIRFFLRAISNL